VNKKQLIVQLIAAACISVVWIYEINSTGYLENRIATAFAESVPALAFGFVLSRWFGKKPNG
jgi:hypothetical protein